VRGLALIDCAAASAAAVASAESVASAAAQAASAPLYAAEAHQKLPRGFAQAALQAWFPELDVNRGGFVSAKDLSFWCTAAGCQGQVSTENLESLFQPSLPSFAGPVAASAAFLVTRAAGGLFSAAAALPLSQDRAFESRRAPTATTLAQAALFGLGQEISLGTVFKSPPRPMATFGSTQLPQPLNPRLSRPSICTPKNFISNHHRHLMGRSRHSLPFLPSKTQGQTHSPLPLFFLQQLCRRTAHLLNHYKFTTERRERRKKKH
jgi:hypothetical protein